ncbi:MAG: RimK family alpha-L-glutamate ligase [Chloroflexota bacterium]
MTQSLFSSILMKILIFAQNAKTHSTRRLTAAAQAQGHEVLVVRPTDCVLRLERGKTAVTYQHHDLTQFDIALLRCVSQTQIGSAIIRPYETYLATQLELAGVRCINTPAAKQLASDKLATAQLLNQANLPIPDTVLAWDLDRVREMIGEEIQLPLAIKLPKGSWGSGVVKADSLESAVSTHHLMSGLFKIATLQEYIAEANHQDIRAFVVGNHVVAAMRRTAQAGDFRANVHLGATAEPIVLSDVVAKTAVSAAQTIGLEVAGVDLLESERGTLIIEVNSTPGLEEIESTTSIDIASQIISLF